jgi:hypothetical protein
LRADNLERRKKRKHLKRGKRGKNKDRKNDLKIKGRKIG